MTQAESDTPRALGYRMPAEWEPHTATWLAWPTKPSDWPGKLPCIPWVFAEMTRQLQRGELVKILVQDVRTRERARRVLVRASADLDRVRFYRVPTDRSWTRDFLPLGVVSGKQAARVTKRKLGAVKWCFNGWARYPDFARDEAAGVKVAKRLASKVWRPKAKLGRKRLPIVMEGGAIDVDGQGTLLATEHCLVSGPHARNPWLGQRGIEDAFAAYLGVRRVLWLPEGIAGDDTSGHVDDFVRFIAPGKVLLCQESNHTDENHALLEAARERLEGSRDAWGRGLEILRLPMPDPVAFDGQRLPASYANFYVGNECVLVPTFNDPKDRIAMGILAEAFPERRVVGIHCSDLVLGLGTLHCSTQQQPAAGSEV